MAGSGTLGPHWLDVTWSLAIEEQFYLILPVLLRLLPPRRLPWVLLALVLSAPIVRTVLHFQHPAGDVSAFVLLPARWDALFIGVLGAWGMRQEALRSWLRSRRSWLIPAIGCGAAALAGLLLVHQGIASPGMSFGGYTLLAALGLLMILSAVLSPEAGLARFLRSSALVSVGAISYGIYLLHQPVSGLLFASILGHSPRIASWREAAVALISLFLTLLLAAISWRWFERPIVRWGQRFGYAG